MGMKITDMKSQVRDANRVSVYVDGRFAFGLTVGQVCEMGLKVGAEIGEEKFEELKQFAEYGKLLQLALEYCLMRERSVKEVKDYLFRKTFSRKLPEYRRKKGKNGEIVREVKRDDEGKMVSYEKKGVSAAFAEQVLEALIGKKMVSDERFVDLWVRNRRSVGGISRRKLALELMKKGVDQRLVEQKIAEVFDEQSGERDEKAEIAKVVAKKARRYEGEPQKFLAYLVRQGFSFDLAKEAVLEISQKD
ncbi:MAG: RecX family transcriptional regulator [Candidatus Nomurabacteria bacterium]|jgi:regulatory protein|nr:RecX family transcriptional regulator [Candidatus Nomurabacteria bacterium]